jgi:hypothetical protein
MILVVPAGGRLLESGKDKRQKTKEKQISRSPPPRSPIPTPAPPGCLESKEKNELGCLWCECFLVRYAGPLGPKPGHTHLPPSRRAVALPLGRLAVHELTSMHHSGNQRFAGP